MSLDAPEYEQRNRAESFGAVAASYDRYRPSYPPELIDDLVAGTPRTVLDIGCGTGKAARLLVARGRSVLGVEIDPQMAAVAREHGIDVEVGAFEQWDDRGRTFDLITCAQAWHWVDPAVGAPKAARLLNPGGLLALFWNFEDLDDATHAVLDRVHAELAPEVVREVMRHQPADRAAELRATGAFATVTTHTYRWHYSRSVDEHVGKLGTQSEYLLLGPDRLARLQEALRAALHELGPQVRLTGGTYTIRARTSV